jgi:hypothetical protein
MVLVPQAVRIRTSGGWRDIALAGSPLASFAAIIGDGSTTVFTVNHGLNATDVMVQVREVGGDQSYVYPEIRRLTDSSVSVIFDVAPSTNQYRVVVAGGIWTPPAYVTSLPASPSDGQEVYYAADPTNGVIWHLRYRAASASAYKWEAVGGGGPPLFARVDTLGTFTGTWADIPSTPTVTLPRSGDYDIEYGMRGDCNNAATGGWFEAAPKVGATATDTPGCVTQFVQPAAANNASGASHSRRLRALAATAGDVVKLQASTSGVQINFMRGWLSVTPVRLS